MSKHCEIMSRMKSNYEGRSKTYLTRRTPVIIRLDGKAFHTYTKHLNKPFDEGLIEDMQQTAIYLCQEIQGAKCAYVQSDEISILLTDYDTLQTDAWFDYAVQKICSVSASLATGRFNQLRYQKVINTQSDYDFASDGHIVLSDIQMANFDSRCFNIPKEEVANYFLARQKDAVKNSISMLAQSLYSHKELHEKSSNEMQELCFQKGHNWNDLHFSKKRGSFIIKNTYWNNELVREERMAYDGDSSDYQNCTDNIIQEGDEYYDKDSIELVTPIIRTKWEVIETPLVFNDNVFSKFL